MAMRSAAELGAEIRRRRQAFGLLQEELAARAGMSISTISRLESGFIRPKLEQVKAIAVALGVSPHTLLETEPQNSDFESKLEKIKSIPELRDEVAGVTDNWEWGDETERAVVLTLLGAAKRILAQRMPSPEAEREIVDTLLPRSRDNAKYGACSPAL